MLGADKECKSRAYFPIFLLGEILLAIPSLLNGFPFLFYDSGFFIIHGIFQMEYFRWKLGHLSGAH